MSKKIIKVNFTGTCSTGKSTICDRLAQEYGENSRLEIYRDYLLMTDELEFPTPIHHVLKITKRQEELENSLIKDCKNYLFCDSGAILYYTICLIWYGSAPDELKTMALNAKNRYDYIFVCNDNLPFDESIPRPDIKHCQQVQSRIIDFLDDNKISYSMLDGSIEERVSRFKEIMSNHK